MKTSSGFRQTTENIAKFGLQVLYFKQRRPPSPTPRSRYPVAVGVLPVYRLSIRWGSVEAGRRSDSTPA